MESPVHLWFFSPITVIYSTEVSEQPFNELIKYNDNIILCIVCSVLGLNTHSTCTRDTSLWTLSNCENLVVGILYFFDALNKTKKESINNPDNYPIKKNNTFKMAKNKKVADDSSLKQLVLSNTKTSGATPEIASNNGNRFF